MSEEVAKVWITTYALSSGVFSVDARIFIGSSTGMIEYKVEGSHFAQYAHSNDWHRSKEAAIKRAEEMRVKKIASLKKQIKKVESLNFLPKGDQP